MGFPFNMLLKDVCKLVADFEVRRDATGVLPYESLAKPGEMVHAMRIRRDGRLQCQCRSSPFSSHGAMGQTASELIRRAWAYSVRAWRE